jgi:hypothetical protein
MRKLVYFSVYLPSDIPPLEYSINTLRSYHDNDTIDILVITTNQHLANLCLAIIGHLKYVHVVDTESDIVRVDAIKPLQYRVFSYPNICDYTTLLYLHNDTVINGNIHPILEGAKDPQQIYRVAEGHEAFYILRTDQMRSIFETLLNKPHQPPKYYDENTHTVMKNAHTPNLSPIIIDSRMMLDQIVDIPKGRCIIAEVGVFKGDFSQHLLTLFSPKQMFLVDPWEPGVIMSGDQDGNNVTQYQGEDIYASVKERFAKNKNTTIIRNYSKALASMLVPACLDLMYIDGDHSYEGVKTDLALAYDLVRPGGWICGHDYEMNPAKTQNVYDFGVKRAVDEFCLEKGMRIWALLRDGCVSYAIRR